jgi:hypothetical protein
MQIAKIWRVLAFTKFARASSHCLINLRYTCKLFGGGKSKHFGLKNDSLGVRGNIDDKMSALF